MRNLSKKYSMSVWGLIGQSYALPLQEFRSLVKVFWLPALVWAIFAIVSEYATRHLTELGAFAQGAQPPIKSAEDIQKLELSLTIFYGLSFVIALYYAITIASGLVRWHRHLIKDHPPESAQSWLQPGEWRFLWRWSWLGLVFVLLGVLVMFVGGCIAFFVMGPEPILRMLDPNSPAVSPTLFAGIFSWIFVLAMGFTGWLFPRTFVSLAAIAVGEGQEYRAVAKQIITRSDCSALALAILATTAPFLLFGIGLPLMMEPAAPDASLPELSALYIAVVVLAHIFNFMAIIVFATMLSLFYREHVVFEAAVGQAASTP